MRRVLGRFNTVAIVLATVASLFLIGLATRTGYAANPACQPNAILVNPCRPWLGASANHYPGYIAALQPQTLYHEQRIGRQVDIVHAYNNPGQTLTSDETYFATRPSTMLYLNWKPATVWANANGSNDATNASIDAMAQSIQSLGATKIFLTVYHEPEDDVSGTPVGCTAAGTGTAGTTDDYRAMWQNVRNRFDALGVKNVVWVMNYMSYAPYRCMDAALWPGNNLVDWVAFDNYGTGAQPNFVTNVGSMYNFLNSSSDADHNYASKPYALAEWGIHGTNVTPQQTYDYSDQAKAAVEGNVFPNLKAYMVFDNSGPDGTENRVGYQNGGVADPVRQQHYNAFANSSAFVDPLPDTTAPTATVLSPSDQSQITGTVSVSATVSDDKSVARAQLYIDGNPIGSPVTDPTTSVSFNLDTSTLGDGAHSVSVQAQDTAGNTTMATPITINVYTPDTQPPTTPTGLTALPSGNSVALAWAPSTDNVGTTVYQVYRDGNLIGTTNQTTFTDTGLNIGQSYSYSVQAGDAAGNMSPISDATVTTIPDTTAPTMPTNLTVTLVGGMAQLSWTASSDNLAVTGYSIMRNGVVLATQTGTSFSDSTVQQGQTYTYTISAYDAAGNSSLAANGNLSIPDTTAPSTPSGLSATMTSSTVNLSWTASTDNVGVTGYKVFRGGILIGQTTTNSYADTTAQQTKTYSYTVQAYDAAGNSSTSSAALSKTIPDVTAPTAPAQPTVKLNSNNSVTVTWKATTDNVKVTGYQVWRNGVQLATTTSLTYIDSTVKQGSSYTYQIYAVDAAGNRSAASPSSKSVAVADTTAPSKPTNLKATSTTARTVTLSWTACTDNVGVAGYYIYNGSTKTATVSGSTLNYNVTGLKSGTSYTFKIQAFDAAGNLSSQSTTVTIKAK